MLLYEKLLELPDGSCYPLDNERRLPEQAPCRSYRRIFMPNTEHRSTSRVLDILELLSQKRTGCTMAEIARYLEAPRSSLFPILHTMEDRGYLRLDGASQCYLIGQQAFLTGSAYESTRPVYDYISGLMEGIVRECQETCHLGILTGGSILYIAKKESPNPIMLRSHIGQRLPAYCTGIGKALLSGHTKEQIEALYPEPLKRYTENTLTDLGSLFEELTETRNSGFAYEHSELTEGICCVAVPLCCRGKVIASLSVSVPAFRATQKELSRIKTLLAESREDAEHYFEEFHICDSHALY